MHDVDGVQGLQSADDLNEQVPNLRLREHGLVRLMLHNLLVQVSIVCVLHHDAVKMNKNWYKLKTSAGSMKDELFCTYQREL